MSKFKENQKATKEDTGKAKKFLKIWAMVAKPGKRNNHREPPAKYEVTFPVVQQPQKSVGKIGHAHLGVTTYNSEPGQSPSGASQRMSIWKEHKQRKILVLGTPGREHSWYKDEKTEDHSMLYICILKNIQPGNPCQMEGAYYKRAHHKCIFKYEEHLKISIYMKHAWQMKKDGRGWDLGFSSCTAMLENCSLLTRGNKIEKRERY